MGLITGVVNGGVILTGPSADGTSGQYLRTNGSGQLSFQSVDLSGYLPLAGGTMVGDILFTDGLYDIGKTGATRPRDLFLSRNLTVSGGGTFSNGLSVTGGHFVNRANGQFYWDTRSVMSSPADGEWLLENFSGTDLLRFNASSATATLGSTNYLHVPNLQADGTLDVGAASGASASYAIRAKNTAAIYAEGTGAASAVFHFNASHASYLSSILYMTSPTTGSGYKFIDCRANGSAVFTIDGAGAVVASGTLAVTGLTTLSNNLIVGNGTTNPTVQFGGTTSSFPMLRRFNTALQCRLADGSGYANWLCANITSFGNVDVTGYLSAQRFLSTLITKGAVGATETIDWSTGSDQTLVLDDNCVLSFTDPGASFTSNLILRMQQDATGSRTVTWPASVRWAGGVAPTLTTTATRFDIFEFWFDGTYYIGRVWAQNVTL